MSLQEQTNIMLKTITSNAIKANSDKYQQLSASLNHNIFDTIDKTIVDYYKQENRSERALTIRIPFELTARDNRHIIIAWTLAKAINKVFFNKIINKPVDGYEIDILHNK